MDGKGGGGDGQEEHPHGTIPTTGSRDHPSLDAGCRISVAGCGCHRVVETPYTGESRARGGGCYALTCQAAGCRCRGLRCLGPVVPGQE